MPGGSAFLAFALAQSLEAGVQSPPPPLRDVRVDAAVSHDPATDVYTYRYKITNPVGNAFSISSITLDLSVPAGTSRPRKPGKLPSGVNFEDPNRFFGPGPAPGGRKTSWAERLRRVSGRDFVTVGLDGPEDWERHEIVAAFSWALLPKIIGASWKDEDQAPDFTRILPGRSLDGFVVTSHGPPGIRSIEFQPPLEELSESRRIPDDWIGEIDDADETLVAKKKRQHSLGFVATTVGPSAPPAGATRAFLVTRLRGLLDQCAELSWISDSGLLERLRNLLSQAAMALESEEETPAPSPLQEFISTIASASPGQRREEAYDLLSLNAEVILNDLKSPAGEAAGTPDAEDESEAESPAEEPGLPDLKVGHLDPPAIKIPYPTKTIKIDEATVNVGTAPAPASKTRYFLSRSPSIDPTAVPIGERDVPPLGAGEASASKRRFPVPSLPDGIYWLLACADSRNEVKESDKGNNCQTHPLTIPALMDVAPK
jgi:hypothetical protein